MDVSDELFIKQRVYEKTKVVYLYPMSRYTISLTGKEAERLKSLAMEKGIPIRVLPKKVIYNAKEDSAFVWDWFLDHDVCPFLEGGNRCRIYDSRPLVCRMFPDIRNEQFFEIQKRTRSIAVSPLPYSELVSRARLALEKSGIEV